MADGVGVMVVAPLRRCDLVAFARCAALDVEVFPYASLPPDAPAGVLAWTATAADDSRRLLGFVAATSRPHSLYVHGLAVAPRERRRGVGRALLNAAVSGAKVARLSRIVLHVGTENRAAVALYESAGFTVHRQLKDFYREGVYEERAAYEMRLSLSQEEEGRGPGDASSGAPSWPYARRW